MIQAHYWQEGTSWYFSVLRDGVHLASEEGPFGSRREAEDASLEVQREAERKECGLGLGYMQGRGAS